MVHAVSLVLGDRYGDGAHSRQLSPTVALGQGGDNMQAETLPRSWFGVRAEKDAPESSPPETSLDTARGLVYGFLFAGVLWIVLLVPFFLFY